MPGGGVLQSCFAARVRGFDLDAFCVSLGDDAEAAAFRRLHKNLLMHVPNDPTATATSISEMVSLLNALFAGSASPAGLPF